MPVSDIIFLAIAGGALTLFGLVLGWASHEETRARRKSGG
jgi:hypothetical protein